MLVKILFIRHYVPRAKIKPQLFRGFLYPRQFFGPMLKHWGKIVRGTLKTKFINTGKRTSTVSIELERGVFTNRTGYNFYFLNIDRNSKMNKLIIFTAQKEIFITSGEEEISEKLWSFERKDANCPAFRKLLEGPCIVYRWNTDTVCIRHRVLGWESVGKGEK